MSSMYSLAQQTLHSVRDVIRFAVSRFCEAKLHFGHGNTSAWDEAVYLTLHTLHLPLYQLEPYLDACLLPKELVAVLNRIEERVNTRKPLAYITQEAWLGDYRFYVDERVIVPRSFIAELLPDALTPWISAESVHHAMDLCTGSGCLAILLAEHYPNATIDALDISTDALAVAARNVKDYGLTSRINLVESDLFKRLKPATTPRYQLIISNPPYVDAQAVANLPAEYQHEPAIALGSGQDGLDAVRQILAQAPQFLHEDGVLVVEIGHHQAALEAAFPELPFIWLETASGTGYVFLLTRDALQPIN